MFYVNSKCFLILVQHDAILWNVLHHTREKNVLFWILENEYIVKDTAGRLTLKAQCRKQD